jgi:hypothetical protein
MEVEGVRWGRWLMRRPGRFTPGKSTLPTVQEARSAPQ